MYKYIKVEGPDSKLSTFPANFVEQIQVDHQKPAIKFDMSNFSSENLSKLSIRSKNSNMDAGYYTACLSKTLALLKEELNG